MRNPRKIAAALPRRARCKAITPPDRKDPSMNIKAMTLAAACGLVFAHAAQAREYFVGGPVHQHDMEIVANYLVGIEMAPAMAHMPTGPDVIHLEADVHATADNVYGYPDGAWVPYLTINYSLQKVGTNCKAEGVLHPM